MVDRLREEIKWIVKIMPMKIFAKRKKEVETILTTYL